MAVLFSTDWSPKRYIFIDDFVSLLVPSNEKSSSGDSLQASAEAGSKVKESSDAVGASNRSERLRLTFVDLYLSMDGGCLNTVLSFFANAPIGSIANGWQWRC